MNENRSKPGVLAPWLGDGRIYRPKILLPANLRLGTGHVARELGRRIPVTWKEAGLEGHLTRRAVRLTDPNGAGIVVSIDGIIDRTEAGSLFSALASALPDWYDLKIIDACLALALVDPRKDGGFWHHPAVLCALMGLSGKIVCGRRYASQREKARLGARIEKLMATEIEILIKRRVHRPGKGWRKNIVPLGTMKLLARDDALGTKLTMLHTGRTRLVRYKVADELFEEAYRGFSIRVPERFFTLRAAAYKIARYAMVRARMLKSAVVSESMEVVATYAGVPEEQIYRALAELKQVGISALAGQANELEFRVPVVDGSACGTRLRTDLNP